MVTVKIPVNRYFGYFIEGGIGYQFLISQEKNYETDTEETRNLGGLGWQGGGGIFYRTGKKSTFTATLFYNSCEATRSYDEEVEGLPVSERVDLSGLGFRLGVLLDL